MLPLESLALFAGRMVVMFPEGRTMQEKSSEEKRVLKKLVDNGGTESPGRLFTWEVWRRGEGPPCRMEPTDQIRKDSTLSDPGDRFQCLSGDRGRCGR